MKHGDVVVTSEEPKPTAQPAAPHVVGAPTTVSLCASHAKIDPLQIDDPWATAKKVHPQKFHIGDPVADLEQRVLDRVLAKVPAQQMEVDDESSKDGRLILLENQVQELQQQQQALAQHVQDQHTEHSKQLGQFQSQVQHQHAQLEHAVQSQAGQLAAFQESFQEQFQQQVAHQKQMLDGMFGRQMSQFEALLKNRE